MSAISTNSIALLRKLCVLLLTLALSLFTMNADASCPRGTAVVRAGCMLDALPPRAFSGLTAKQVAPLTKSTDDVTRRIAQQPGAVVGSVSGNHVARNVGAAQFINSSQLARYSGTLRAALVGKGNFGIGRGTRAEADLLGKAWVGPKGRLTSDSQAYISHDELRRYRPPAIKRNSPEARTGSQANFERRDTSNGNWTHNGHYDIID